MARIRTVKPEFWTNEDLAECSEASRLLALGLLNHSDDEGYFKAHEGLIKAAVFPITDPSMSIQTCIKQLCKAGYLRIFEGSDGKRYGQVKNFDLHQRINRPTPSKIRALDKGEDEDLSDHGKLHEDSSPERKGKEQGKEQVSTSSSSDERDILARRVIDYLNEKTGKGFKVAKTNLEHVRARIAEGYTFDQFKHAIDAKVNDWTGTPQEMYLRPTTLFNSKKFDGYVNQPITNYRDPGHSQPDFDPGENGFDRMHSLTPFGEGSGDGG